MYYGKHGPFKRAEAGQAMTFENDKVIGGRERERVGQEEKEKETDIQTAYSGSLQRAQAGQTMTFETNKVIGKSVLERERRQTVGRSVLQGLLQELRPVRP